MGDILHPDTVKVGWHDRIIPYAILLWEVCCVQTTIKHLLFLRKAADIESVISLSFTASMRHLSLFTADALSLSYTAQIPSTSLHSRLLLLIMFTGVTRYQRNPRPELKLLMRAIITELFFIFKPASICSIIQYTTYNMNEMFERNIHCIYRKS